MDPDGYMCKRQSHSNGSHAPSADRSGVDAARKALEIVGQMRKRLQMADGWFKTIRRVHLYFIRMKKDFYRNTRSLEASSESGNSPESYRHLSLREGGAGGGLEEYKLLEKILKEFGSLEAEDLDMPDADADTAASRLGQGLDEGSDAGSAAVMSEGMDITEGTPDSASVRQERWNAINSVAAAASQRAESGNGTPILSNGTMQTLGVHPHANYFQVRGQSPQKHQLLSPTQSSAMAQHEQGGFNQGTPGQHQYGSPPTNPGLAQAFPGSTDQARQASLSLQQQLQPQHPPQQPTTTAAWSPATKEMWLNSLETRFGGDDVAAFVAGNSWEDWAGMAAREKGGWLSAVWGGSGR